MDARRGLLRLMLLLLTAASARAASCNSAILTQARASSVYADVEADASSQGKTAELVGHMVGGNCHLAAKVYGSPTASVISSGGNCRTGGLCYKECDTGPNPSCVTCASGGSQNAAFSTQSDACLVGGVCFYEGQHSSSGSACYTCQPSVSQTSLSMRSSSCAVGNSCYWSGQRPSATSCYICDTSYSTTSLKYDSAGMCEYSGSCYSSGATHPALGCLTCSSGSWTVQSGKCFIDNSCYNHNDNIVVIAGGASFTSSCEVCNSAQPYTPAFASNHCRVPKTPLEVVAGDTRDYACYPNGGTHASHSCRVCNPAVSITALQTASGTCFIDGSCYQEGSPFSLGGQNWLCEACQSALSQSAWTPVATTCRIPGTPDAPFTSQFSYTCHASDAFHPTGTCATCVPATSQTAWQLNPLQCLIDDHCYVDDQLAAVDGSDWACEACNSTLSQTEWTFVERTCRDYAELPAAPFSSEFNYVCYEPFQHIPGNQCVGCVGEYRAGASPADIALGPGSFEPLDFLPCDDGNDCTTVDHCSLGECATHYDGLRTKDCEYDECATGVPGSEHIIWADQSDAVQQLGTEFRVTREGGVVVSRLGYPTQGAADVVVSLVDLSTGDELLSVDFGSRASIERSSLRYVEFFTTERVHLKKGFHGIVIATSPSGGIVGFTSPVDITDADCEPSKADEWLDWVDVFADNGGVMERTAADCTVIRDGVADVPGDFVSNYVAQGVPGATGARASQARAVLFAQVAASGSSAVAPMMWDGPPTSRFLADNVYRWAGAVVPTALGDADRALCGRLEGKSDNLPSVTGASIRIIRPLASLTQVPGGANDELSVANGRIRGRNSDVLVRILVDDDMQAEFTGTVGTTLSFSVDLGSVSGATDVTIEIFRSGDVVGALDPLLQPFDAAFDRFEFDLVDPLTGVAKASFPDSFSAETLSLGEWQTQCLRNDAAGPISTVDATEGIVLWYGAISMAEETRTVQLALENDRPSSVVLQPGYGPSGQTNFADSHTRDVVFSFNSDATSTTDYTVQVVVGTTVASSGSCTAGTPCVMENDPVGVVQTSDRIRVVFSATAAGSTGNVHFSISESTAVLVRGPTIGITEQLLCSVDGMCVPDGTLNPANECQACQVGATLVGWTDTVFAPCSSCTADACICSAAAECVEDKSGTIDGGAAPEQPVSLPPFGLSASPVTAPPGFGPTPVSVDDLDVDVPPMEVDGNPCSALDDFDTDDLVVLQPSDGYWSSVSEEDGNPLAAHEDLAALLDEQWDIFDLFAAGNVTAIVALDADATEVAAENGTDVTTAFTNGLIEGAGVVCIVIDEVTVPIVQVVDNAMGKPFPYPLPDGFGVLAERPALGLALTLSLTNETAVTNAELELGLPDGNLFSGTVLFSDFVGTFNVADSKLTAESQLDVTIPVLNVQVGSYNASVAFVFVSPDSYPGIGLAFSTDEPFDFEIVPGMLWVAPVSGKMDIGAGEFQLAGDVEIHLPFGIGSIGRYAFDLAVVTDLDGFGPPAFADALDGDDAASNATDVGGTRVSLNVQISDRTIDIIPGTGIIKLSPTYFGFDTLGTMGFGGIVELSVPGWGNSLGAFDSQLDIVFPSGELFEGDALFDLVMTAVDDGQEIMVIDDLLFMTPKFANLSTSTASIDVVGDVRIVLYGNDVLVSCRLQCQWEDDEQMFDGTEPDVIASCTADVEYDENGFPVDLVFVDIFSPLLSTSFLAMEINTAEDLVKAAAAVRLTIPTTGRDLDYVASMELNYGEEDGSILLDLQSASPQLIDLIPGLVSVSIDSGSLSSADSKIIFVGSLDMPFLPVVTASVKAEWSEPNFEGEPEIVVEVTPGANGATTVADVLALFGLSANDIDAIPLPVGNFEIQSVVVEVTKRAVSISFGAKNRAERIRITDTVAVFDLKLDIFAQFGQGATREGTSVDTVTKAASSTSSSSPGAGSSTSVGFSFRGKWAVDGVLGDVLVSFDSGEWVIDVGFEKLSFANMAKKLIGGLPGAVGPVLDALELSDAQMSLRLTTFESTTVLFSIKGTPSSDVALEVLGEDETFVEVVVGYLNGKVFLAGIMTLQPENLMAFAGKAFGFPLLVDLPFTGSHVTISLSTEQLVLADNPMVRYEEIVPPPVVINNGIQFAYNMFPSEKLCASYCKAMVDAIPGFDSVPVTMSLTRADGGAAVIIAALLDFEVSVGPFTLDSLEFKLTVPVPSLHLAELALTASTEIYLAPRYPAIQFDFQIGYKPYKLEAYAFLDGFLPYFFLPFVTVGDLFVIAEISEAPTLGVGATVLFGHDCLNDEGRMRTDADCAFARGTVGVGQDQYVRAEISNLTFKFLLRMVFDDLFDNVDFGPLGNLGFPGKRIISFSARERTLPDGQYIPVGLYFEGPVTIQNLFEIGNMRVLIPLTPTMIRICLGDASVSSSMLAEIARGYQLILAGSPSPLSIAGGAIQFVRAPDDLDNGPEVSYIVTAKPISAEFGFSFTMSGYLRFFNLFEAYAVVTRTPFQMHAEFFAEIPGFRVFCRLYGDVMGGSFRPLNLEESQMSLLAVWDAEEINRVTVAPINNVILDTVAVFTSVLRKVPLVGGTIAGALEDLTNTLLLQVNHLFMDASLTPNRAAYRMSLDARVLGRNRLLSVAYSADPSVVMNSLYHDTVVPLLNKIYQRRGSKATECASDMNRWGVGSAAVCVARNCPSGYTDLGLLCREKNCPSGYSDWGLVCKKFTERSEKAKRSCSGPSFFRVCTSYCPLFYRPNKLSLSFDKCLKTEVHIYTKKIKRKSTSIPNRCPDTGYASKERWGLFERCYPNCRSSSIAVGDSCIGTELLTGAVRGVLNAAFGVFGKSF